MQDIVEKFVLQLEQQLAERHVAITLTPEARAWLAVKGYDPVFGARPLGRVIQKEVRDPLTDEILFGALEQGGTVTIGLADDRLTFEYERRNRPRRCRFRAARRRRRNEQLATSNEFEPDMKTPTVIVTTLRFGGSSPPAPRAPPSNEPSSSRATCRSPAAKWCRRSSTFSRAARLAATRTRAKRSAT